MKYKVTEMDTYSMKVEYEDGTWAMIPSVPNMDKDFYLIQIQNHQPKDSEVALKDHPMKIGDEGVVGEGISEEAKYDGNPSWGYDDARAIAYPSSGCQWDALYWAGKGNNTFQDAINVHIEMVKEKFPKNDTKYTPEQMETAMKELMADSRWVES